MEDNLTKINAEGGELVISNGSDVAIIPKKYAREVEDMLKEKCFKCLDALVSELPTGVKKAQDGAVLNTPLDPALESRLEYYMAMDAKMQAATDPEEIKNLGNERVKAKREDLQNNLTINHRIGRSTTGEPVYYLAYKEIEKFNTLLKQREEAKLLAENKAALEESKAITQDAPEVNVTEATVIENAKPVASVKSVEVKSPDLKEGERRVAVPGFGINKIVKEENGKAVTLFWENRNGIRIPGNYPTNKTFQYAKTFEELTKDKLYESLLK
jgi:hypothetical protein